MMKTLFTVAATTSILTSCLLFMLLYSYPHSSVICINYTHNPSSSVWRQHDLPTTLVQDRQNHSSVVRSLTSRSVGYTSSTPSTHHVINGTTHYVPNATNPINNTLTNLEAVTAKEFYMKNTTPFFKSWARDYMTDLAPALRQNCTKLLLGDPVELKRTQLLQKSVEFHVNADYSNCDSIRSEFLDNFYVSQAERDFPIAYILVVHTNAQQIFRFLKTIYRPHNHYCIHADPSSGIKDFAKKFEILSKCLPNVILPSQVNKVKYHHPNTIFRAQMSCFRDLLKLRDRTKWRYVINLCGRELPLKTNRQIVESLKKMNGTSVIKPHPIDQYTLEQCFSKVASRVADDTNCTGHNESAVTIATVEKCDAFLRKHNLRLYKSMAYNALSHKFVSFFLYDQKMQALQKWMLNNCRTPEEHFYAMASVAPGAPVGDVLHPSDNVPIVFRAIWYHYRSSPHRLQGETCAGKVVHQICIVNAAELPRIHDTMKNSTVWFFNKYFMENDHAGIDCVEQELIRTNKIEFLRDYKHFNSS